jgi:hypothetical protein
MEVSGQPHASVILTHWLGGLCGSQIWSGCGGKEEHHSPWWEFYLGCPAQPTVTKLTELFWLTLFFSCSLHFHYKIIEIIMDVGIIIVWAFV